MPFLRARPAGKAGSVFFLAGLFLLAACTAKAWSPDPSQPAAAVFYPDEVQVTVEERLMPETLPSGGKGFLLAIPAGVRAETFIISINEVVAGGYYWLPAEERDAALAARTNRPVPGRGALPEHEPSPERRALLEALIPLREETARREGEMAGIEARLALWGKSLERFEQGGDSREAALPAAPTVADEAAGLDALYKAQYPGLFLEREQCRRALVDARLRLEEAQKKLDEFDRKAGCELVAVPFSGQAASALVLRYSYVLPASSSFSYRLTAYPDKEEIVIAQEATLYQSTGFAWRDTDVFLSTLRRDRALSPLHIGPWKMTLESRNKPAPIARKSMSPDSSFSAAQAARVAQYDLAAGEAAPEAELRQAAAPRDPVQEERSTFRLWSLGKQRVESTFPVRLALASDRHKATFLYTLRPVSNDKGFLTADLTLPRALELSLGMAQFAVDDVVIGSRMFSFNGNKGTIFFGSDPQVTAVMRDMKQSSGEEGLFNKDETREWHWRITLKSTRAKAVAAWLEDPAPRAAHESIKIAVDSSPAPEEIVNPPEDGGARIYRWKVTLKPGEPVVINHKVRATAPLSKEMELNPGR